MFGRLADWAADGLVAQAAAAAAAPVSKERLDNIATLLRPPSALPARQVRQERGFLLHVATATGPQLQIALLNDPFERHVCPSSRMILRSIVRQSPEETGDMSAPPPVPNSAKSSDTRKRTRGLLKLL